MVNIGFCYAYLPDRHSFLSQDSFGNDNLKPIKLKMTYCILYPVRIGPGQIAC